MTTTFISQDEKNGEQIALADNLINALNKLQHRALDKELLGGKSFHKDEELTIPFFAFTIGVHHFLVNAQCFCEVFVDVPIAALPNSSTCLLGLCNIRGLLIPVYQLHSFFSATRPKKLTIFCIGKGEKTLGLVVDSLPVSLTLRQREQVPLLSDKHPLLNLLTESTYLVAGSSQRLINGDLIGKKLLELSAHEQQYSLLTAATQADALSVRALSGDTVNKVII